MRAFPVECSPAVSRTWKYSSFHRRALKTDDTSRQAFSIRKWQPRPAARNDRRYWFEWARSRQMPEKDRWIGTLIVSVLLLFVLTFSLFELFSRCIWRLTRPLTEQRLAKQPPKIAALS